MSTIDSQVLEALGRKSYRRKDKSLGLLVSNFLDIYNREGVDLIGLDDAAANLGVERRRIYDVVNILEAIGLVARRGKSQYSWRGFGAVPRVLDQLKEEGMKEKIGIIPCVTNSEMVLYEQEREDSFKLTPLENQDNSTTTFKLGDDQENSKTSLKLGDDQETLRVKTGIIPCVTNSEMVLYEQEREESFKLATLDDQENSKSLKLGDDQENSTSLKLDNKKILWLLAQNFVKLFLCSDADVITLDSVTKALVHEALDPLTMKTKIRRLYDIANVFSALKLIEKTHIPVSRKTAYRWLGFESMSENRLLAPGSSSLRLLAAAGSSSLRLLAAVSSSQGDDDGKESNKRLFGIDISNLEAKSSKRYRFEDPKFSEKQKKSDVNKEQNCESKAAGKSSASGSATPAADNNSDPRPGRLAEIEALASTYRPQYVNPVLIGAFGHYTDTLKTWLDQSRPN